jgi:hypothetical protein
MIELQKFIDELEADKQRATELALKHFESEYKHQAALELGKFTALCDVVEKARLLLKRQREQQP